MLNETSEMKSAIGLEVKKLAKIGNLLARFSKLESAVKDNLPEAEAIIEQVRYILPSAPVDVQTRQNLEHWIATQKDLVINVKDDFKKEFGYLLSLALKEQGYILEGNIPELKTKFYTIRTDFQTYKASILFLRQTEVEKNIKLTVKDVLEAIKRIDSKLIGRVFDANAFLRELYDSYVRIACRTQNRSFFDSGPARVAIGDILTDVAFHRQTLKFKLNPTKENYQGYSREEFSYDLYKLFSAKVEAVDGKQLVIESATRETTARGNFILVPNDKGDGEPKSAMFFKGVN